MEAINIFWITLFASLIIFEVIFSIGYILFVKKIIKDEKKQRNAIINYLFMTIFIVIAIVAGILSNHF